MARYSLPKLIGRCKQTIHEALIWLAIYFVSLVWSAIAPLDYFTWFLEAAPALIGLAILAWTYQRFPLTPLTYTLILIHCLILFLGATIATRRSRP